MQSRCLPALIKLLNDEEDISKYKAAHHIHCDPKTAQRLLMHLHVEGIVRITGWVMNYNHFIPQYSLADGVMDVPKPRAAEILERKNAVRRNSNKVKSKQVLGMFGI